LAKTGRRDEAIFFGKQAVNTLQRMRRQQQALGRALETSFLSIHADYYRGLAALLIEAGRLAEAQQVLNMLKEDEYFQFIRGEAGADKALTTIAGLTPEEQECQRRYEQIRSQVVSLARERAELENKGASRALTPSEQRRLQALEQDIGIAVDGFGRVLEALGQEAPARGGVDADYLANIKAMQDTLARLGPGTVLLHYVVTPRKLYVLLTTPDIQVAGTNQVEEAALNERVWEFRAVLNDPTREPRPLAQELYRLLLRPIADDLRRAGARTLLVSLDGALRYIPLAALHDGKQYFVQNYRVVLFTEAVKDKLTDRPGKQWQVAALGVSQKVAELDPLPYVQEELAGIVSVAGGTSGVLPGTIRMNEEFTRQELRRGLGLTNSVVHIASHFVFRPGNPSDSYLLLGDGKMTLTEMKRADLRFGHTDLLTLSACETAVSERRLAHGGEMEGFATMAQQNGARAILATLWPVADASTCEFMKRFYAQHGGPAVASKAEALQRVQVAFLEGSAGPAVRFLAKADGRGVEAKDESPEPRDKFISDPNAPYAHPYYWAPFVLIGNWL
jgi:CHAT domain-containing protein